MPPDNALVIDQFYRAFQARDFRTMQTCYHEQVVFSDPVFQQLKGKEANAMWHMLIANGSDLQLTWRDVKAAGDTGTCYWEAAYTFSGSGRKVVNIIHAVFEFRDGKIFRHTDQFDLWKWTRMALGITGILLGWSNFFQNKIRKKAGIALHKFIEAHPEYR
ncbi:MAG: nuclear transport factor 2 family protein [Chitinophagales bacterium]|nr:nuclear transport factor 2 family protein [Chitinophagales bacterium]